METCSLTEIKSLGTELDLYERKKRIDTGLVSRGLYLPLPVSGNVLIWGFALIEASERCGIDSYIVSRLPEMDRHSMLTLSLRLEDRPGEYSWDEKLKIVSYAGWKTVPDDIIGLIQGRDDPSLEARLRAYERLPGPVKECVRLRYCDIKTAVANAGLPEGIFSVLLEKKDKKRLSFSDTRILLEWVSDIMKRDKLPESGIVKLVEEILLEADPMAAAARKRFPLLTHLNGRFERISKEVLAGTGVTMKAPPYFEGGSFSISFSFSGKRNLLKKIAAIERLGERTDELFELL
ncbi:MAG: hypothetical protein JW881_18225 [Spirochaetales bacterium]|nr:hypothetical protein [Spirochaetales bacterium]